MNTIVGGNKQSSAHIKCKFNRKLKNIIKGKNKTNIKSIIKTDKKHETKVKIKIELTTQIRKNKLLK